jgi:hypothetical protein
MPFVQARLADGYGLQMIPFGAGINGSLAIAKAVGVDEARGSWIVASYPYVFASTR